MVEEMIYLILKSQESFLKFNSQEMLTFSIWILLYLDSEVEIGLKQFKKDTLDTKQSWPNCLDF